MKALTLTLLAVFSFSAFSQIWFSDLDKRHQEVIRKALVKKCDVPNAWLNQISNKTTRVSVDQGITDYDYETVIEVEGNGVVTVFSSYGDMYNHTEQDWGVYSVQSIVGCDN